MSETRTIDIQTLLKWNEPKLVKQGTLYLRKAAPTEQFWALWKSNRQALKDVGISCKPVGASWEILWFQPVNPEKRREEKAQHEQAVVASRSADSTRSFPHPDGLAFLGYQKAGIDYAITAFGRGKGWLCADEMGLGKTIQTIGVINAGFDIKSVIVICPNTLKINWRRELKKWLTRPLSIGVAVSTESFPATDIVVINYDIVRKFASEIASRSWDLRIADECHYCKNRTALRTKATYSIPARLKIALSGTPIENRPVELWTTLCDLDPETWNPKNGFMQFARNFCGAKHNGFGWDFNGASNTDLLQYKLRSTIMVRRLKSDVLTELPAKRRQIIELDSTGCAALLKKEAAEAAAIEADLELLKARVELARCSESKEDYQAAVAALRGGQGVAFEKMAERRHETAIAKLPQVIQFAHDSLENGKILVFCHHIDIAETLKVEFPQAAVITGDTPAMKRQSEVDRFQNDPTCNVFIGNLAAAEGITCTAGSHVIFAELQWTPGKHSQMEDRAHRIGQKSSVLCSYLVLENSLDARMAKVIVEKLNVIDRCLDKETGYAEADVEDVEPVNSVRLSFEEIKKQSTLLPTGVAEVAHRGLRILAGLCDGALARDDRGFNGSDTFIGHKLAGLESLSPKQAVLACRILPKYKRQIPEVIDKLNTLLGKVDNKEFLGDLFKG